MAVVVFAEHGFHQTSMNDVAEAAGVTKPVLYQHFASKRDLYRELLEDVGGRLRESIRTAAAAAGTPRQQVEAGFRAYFRFVSEQHADFQLLFGGGTRRDAEFADTVRAVERSIADIVAALIEVPGLDRDRRRLLAHAIVGLAEGTSRHWLASGAHGDVDELSDHVAQLAWAGLRGVKAV